MSKKNKMPSAQCLFQNEHGRCTVKTSLSGQLCAKHKKKGFKSTLSGDELDELSSFLLADARNHGFIAINIVPTISFQCSSEKVICNFKLAPGAYCNVFYEIPENTEDRLRDLLHYFRDLEGDARLETEVDCSIPIDTGRAEKFVGDRPEECPICSEGIKDETSLTCGHWICSECVINLEKEECPLCRSSLVLSDDLKKKFLSKKEEKERKRQSNLELLEKYAMCTGQFLFNLGLYVDTELVLKLKKVKEETEVLLRDYKL